MAWPPDPGPRAGTLRLYGSVWPFLPRAIARAASWGSEWFRASTPVLLERDGEVLAHVGIAELDWCLAGAPLRAAALHAVCVREDRRGQGLGRQAIELALAEIERRGIGTTVLWSEKTDFYGRFGFAPRREARFELAVPGAVPTRSRPLDPDQPQDLRLLLDLLARRVPVSEGLAAADSGWHFLIDLAIEAEASGRPPRESLLHLPDHDCVLVHRRRDDALELLDLIAPEVPPLAVLVGAVGVPVARLEVAFTPDRLGPVLRTRPCPDEDLLLVRGDLPGSEGPFGLSPLTRT